jgi:surfeit locus 1 family protein
MTTLIAPHGRLSARRLRPLLWPGVMAFAMLLVLSALGAWQIQRLHWKEGIIAQIAAAERAPAAPMPARPRPFEKIFVRGRFLPGPTALYGVDVRERERDGGIMGGQLIQPFRADDGTLMLVDRGWVPDSDRDGVPYPPGETTLTGFTRLPVAPWTFGAPDDPATRRFFTLDPARIAAALGMPKVAPYTLEVMGPTVPGVLPQPAQHLPRPPNNHLNYAMTWFGLAGALVVIFISWSRKKLLETDDRL